LYYWEVGTDATNYFLPFLRLAPVQCTSWGVQVTSGVPQIQYYLSSELVEPSGAASHYSERLVTARTLLCYRSRQQPGKPGMSRLRFGFDRAEHLYVCPQQLGKMHPDFDRPLAQLLRRDPCGKLVLTADTRSQAAHILRARHQQTMPDVADRIVYLPRQEYDAYLALLAVADVLLDPPYFGGVNTTYDGLAAGTPIVTCPSGFHRGRYTYGCYQKLDLRDCVARDFDQYVDIALRLGTDRDYRRSISRQLVERADLLFEDAQAVTEHERLFRQIIEAGDSSMLSPALG
jgi:predicted O-linked N-acetylglucosamine transferase (SPINDLY family)